MERLLFACFPIWYHGFSQVLHIFGPAVNNNTIHMHVQRSFRRELPDGTLVPEHFHLTEVGVVTKYFIDCGGNVRTEKKANFQLWDANDFEHHLKPQKLTNIISLSERILGIEYLEVEVEYRGDTIGKYDLNFNGENFVLRLNKRPALPRTYAVSLPIN